MRRSSSIWADQVRRQLSAPRVHTVLLTPDVNAAVAQVPWFGIIGPARTYLVVGLALLQALSKEQFAAVLAHEFGHLSRRHTRLGAWIYRIRATWGRIRRGLEGQAGGAPLRRFVGWYAPYFNAYTFVLARAQELDADRFSAEVAGARNAADALLASHLYARLLDERFWSDVERRSAFLPTPPSTLCLEMGRVLGDGVETAIATRWVMEAMLAGSDAHDTHPSLAERLAALGEQERVPPFPSSPVSEVLLGASAKRLQAALSTWWAGKAARRWKQLHEKLGERRKRLEELEAAERKGPLSADEAWERADLTEDLRAETDALPLFQEVLAVDPGHARAHFSVGRILLGRADASGLSHLEQAMALDRKSEGACCELMARYWRGQGRPDQARALDRRRASWAEAMREAQEERSRLAGGDAFAPHGLDAGSVLALAEQVGGLAEVEQAWLVRKRVQRFPEVPLFVLVVRAGAWWRYRGPGASAKLTRRIANKLSFPGETFVLDAEVTLGKRIRRLQGALIYQRDRGR